MAWRRRAHDASSATSERSQWLRCQGVIQAWLPGAPPPPRSGAGSEGLADALQEAASFMLPAPWMADSRPPLRPHTARGQGLCAA
jgi:hypothetical protein